VNFNQDCWLLLLGFPNDYWAREHVDSALSPFGRVVTWRGDKNKLTYLIVKARVVDLASVPHFIVFTDAEGYAGDKWTIQVEIMQHEHLGEGPPEDPIPVQAEGDGPPQFDFLALDSRSLVQLQLMLSSKGKRMTSTKSTMTSLLKIRNSL
jgi:hypothetical protein